MRIKEIIARSIIVSSKLPGADYVVNPYVGCSFACSYCYASFMGRLVDERLEAWGDYVYVKSNAVALFEKELERLMRRMPRATLMMSSVTDAWQGPEKKYRLTRGILERLVAARYPGMVSLLTKSPLVLRDLALIAALPNAELGVTITSPDDVIGRELEARAPSTHERFVILEKANQAGIATYAFIGPLLPHYSLRPDRLEEVFRRLVDVGTTTIFAEQLNTSAYIRRRLLPLVEAATPEVQQAYTASRGQGHRRTLEALVRDLAARHGVTMRFDGVLDHVA